MVSAGLLLSWLSPTDLLWQCGSPGASGFPCLLGVVAVSAMRMASAFTCVPGASKHRLLALGYTRTRETLGRGHTQVPVFCMLLGFRHFHALRLKSHRCTCMLMSCGDYLFESPHLHLILFSYLIHSESTGLCPPSKSIV